MTSVNACGLDMRSTYKHLILLLSLLVGFGFSYQLVAQTQQDQNTEQQFERARQAYQAEDYVLAQQIFKPLAEAGDSKSQIYMGGIYDRGLGVERDHQQAMYWYEKSAEQGGIKLQHELALRYLHGKGIERDDSKALYWWKKAADAGSSQAQYNLALMYLRGDGTLVDPPKALELFRLAAGQGLRDAQYALGLAYTTGQYLPLDYAEAYRLFKLSAQQGYPAAQYNLAALTESGEGTTTDIKEALVWYRKAAEQDHHLAQQRLAKLERQAVSATITTPAAMVIHDQVWIKEQPAAHYTIQINVIHDKDKLIRWLKSQQPLTPLAYYPQQQNGQVAYKAIYGSFVDQAAAQKALNELPDNLRQSKPWLRGFGAVQKQLSAE